MAKDIPLSRRKFFEPGLIFDRDSILNQDDIACLNNHLPGHTYAVDDEINFGDVDWDSLIDGASRFCQALSEAVVDYRDANP